MAVSNKNGIDRHERNEAGAPERKDRGASVSGWVASLAGIVGLRCASAAPLIRPTRPTQATRATHP